ncbi:unnamed protein product [Pleuronectes platessa]|uniref:Uncharacterized protein n=1 Tax=Pleuronectes platessa TaxID=8262 RepID=A0A9N7UTG7_PLEPL|nr:unnamed protein product [Pleuronectes platessa]
MVQAAMEKAVELIEQFKIEETIQAFVNMASSPSFESLNYKLDSTAQIALPKMSRVVVAETLKFDHLALELTIRHLYPSMVLSGQAQAKTTVKVDLRNEAETPFIKNSLLVASANANLHDLKAELKANHDTELYGATPAISELNLYEQTGLDKILTTTEQTVDVDAKIVYQKRKAAPLVDVMGLVHIPHLGDLITELSLKSAILNLNANAGLYTEDNVVFRLGATTVSVFEGLKCQTRWHHQSDHQEWTQVGQLPVP